VLKNIKQKLPSSSSWRSEAHRRVQAVAVEGRQREAQNPKAFMVFVVLGSMQAKSA
jgi:hypothetical protein